MKTHDSRRAPRRPWLQFSLRTLFIVMIFAAGYFAGFATLTKRVQQLQRQAVAAEHAARMAAEQARMQAELQRVRAEAALATIKAGDNSTRQSRLTEEVSTARPD